MIQVSETSRILKSLMDGVAMSLQHVIPIPYEIKGTRRVDQSLHLHFGVLIGFVGDLKGKLVLTADGYVFSSIGEVMFGMSIGEEMLPSFSGELGNIIAGNLITNIKDPSIQLDITAPTIIQGDTKLSGYKSALQTVTEFHNTGRLNLYFLID